jgi:hypothetical protein
MMVLKSESHAKHFPLATFEFSERFKVKAQTVRRRLCERGSYYGFVPVKLPNGRLAWPEVVVTADGPQVL